MVEPTLVSANRLLQRGYTQEALELLQQYKPSTFREQINCLLTECKILIKLSKNDDAYQLLSRISELIKQKNMSLTEFEVSTLQATLLRLQAKYDDALALITQTEDFLDTFNTSLISERHAYLLKEKGLVWWYKGDLFLAQTSFEAAKSLFEQAENPIEVGNCLNNIGNIYVTKGELDKGLEYYLKSLEINEREQVKPAPVNYNNIGAAYHQKGELKQTLDYYHKGATLAREVGDRFYLVFLGINLGTVYSLKGEFEEARKYQLEALKYAEEMNNEEFEAYARSGLGQVYYAMGNFKEAFEYVQPNLAIREKIGNPLFIGTDLLLLITISLDAGSTDLAQKYLQKLEQVDKQNQNQNKRINQMYRLAQALYLKAGPENYDQIGFATLYQILNRYIISKELLSSIVSEEVLNHEITVQAIFNLCELLLIELKMFGNEQTLTQVSDLTIQLLRIGTAQNSFSLLAQTYFLMAKLALLKPDVEKSKELLQKAEIIANEKGYDRLATVIAREQKLLEGKMVDLLLDETLTLTDRLENLQIEQLVVSLRQNRVEQYQENPITRPSMEDLRSFTNRLKNRKFEW